MHELASPQQQECFERVAAFMQQAYGESAEFDAERSSWRLIRGGVMVRVGVAAWGEDRAIVGIDAWVVLRSEPSEEFFRFIAERNYEQRFGSFAVDPVGDLQFAYRLPAHIIDKVSLCSGIESVFWTTTTFDREIAARFGGVRPCDVASPAEFECALDEAGLRPPEKDAA